MGNNRPYVICPEYEKIWEEEKIEEMNRKKMEEEKKEKIYVLQRNTSANDKKVKNITDLGFDKINTDELNGKRKLVSDNKLNTKNHFNEINEFLKEFEDIKTLDTFEDRKYNTPTKINTQEINSFYDFIKQKPEFL